MQEYGTITMFRGGDANFRLYFPGSAGEPLDLTGYTATPFEPHALLVNKINLVIESPLLGGVYGTIAWDSAYQLGTTMSFYAQLSKAGVLVSAPKLLVKVI